MREMSEGEEGRREMGKGERRKRHKPEERHCISHPTDGTHQTHLSETHRPTHPDNSNSHPFHERSTLEAREGSTSQQHKGDSR